MRYPLVGGPCDGTQSLDYPVRPFVGYQEFCRTHTYSFAADNRFHDIGVSAIFAGSATLDTKQIGRAFHRLMLVPAVEAPAAIRRSQAARARLRRLVR